jgi:Uncharacterized conserved protein
LKKINRKVLYIFFLFFLNIILLSQKIYAKNNWDTDKNLSEINLKLSIIPGDDIVAKFSEFESLLSVNNEEENKMILSLKLSSLNLKNEDLKKFLINDNFFNLDKYPIILIEIKNFDFKKKQNHLAQIQINDLIKSIPISINISELTKEFFHIDINFDLSRKDFNLGVNNLNFLSNQQSILLDNLVFEIDLFLMKEIIKD